MHEAVLPTPSNLQKLFMSLCWFGNVFTLLSSDRETEDFGLSSTPLNLKSLVRKRLGFRVDL